MAEEQLRIVCTGGSLQEARSLVSRLMSEGVDVRGIVYRTCRALCRTPSRTSFDILKWLAETLDLTYDEVGGMDSLRDVCYGGNGLIVQWFCYCFDMSMREHDKDVNVALNAACDSGNLDVVKWLCYYFGFTPDDIRFDDNLLLCTACASGNTELVSWLSSHFALNEYDAAEEDWAALRCACSSGSIEMVELVVSVFGVSKYDIQNVDNELLAETCLKSHISVMEWLWERGARLGRSRDGVCKFAVEVLKTAGIDVAHWIIDRYDMSMDEIIAAVGEGVAEQLTDDSLGPKSAAFLPAFLPSQ